MFRILTIFAACAPLCCAQSLPAFRWAVEVDGSGVNTFAGLGADMQGNTYVAGSTQSPNFAVVSAVQDHSAGGSDVYVTKLDPSGSIVYSTYFGGTGNDIATAMSVDPAGNVYVTGYTTSVNFPTTRGVYSPSVPPSTPVTTFPGPGFSQGSGFVFKLNPDGSLGYSTYATPQGSTPDAIAVDSAGSVYLTGATFGGLPTTPGAYQAVCGGGLKSNGFFGYPASDAFLMRFDAAGSKLVFSTYLGVLGAAGLSMALSADGSVYIPSAPAMYRVNATGSALLATATLPGFIPTITALATDGSVYLAGFAGGTPAFVPTPGAFQTAPNTVAGATHTALVKVDAQLQTILAATYFVGADSNSVKALTADATGNVYLGGTTTHGSLPTRTPFFQGFGASFPELGVSYTGFLAELSGDLSTLLFSSEFGDNELFAVTGVATGSNGNVVLGGATGAWSPPNPPFAPANIWVNRLTLALPPSLPPSLRIDAVENAASLRGNPISGSETIRVRGAGFGKDAQVMIGGAAAIPISFSPDSITAVAPSGISANATKGAATTVQVLSGNASSNPVTVALAPASPGLFSADGSGFGQGYILNDDGTLNTPSNPAKPKDRITIYATGVGPVSFTEGYAVTQYQPNVFINGIYCNGVSAAMGPVAGFPGDVYRLTVYVPDLAMQPGRSPLFGLTLQIDGAFSQNGLTISIAP
jgi:uncharacterized protein (TIGR03437 family)